MLHYGTLWYIMLHYGTLWYIMLHYGTLWYIMVHYGTLCNIGVHIRGPSSSAWGNVLPVPRKHELRLFGGVDHNDLRAVPAMGIPELAGWWKIQMCFLFWMRTGGTSDDETESCTFPP